MTVYTCSSGILSLALNPLLYPLLFLLFIVLPFDDDFES